MAAGLCLLDTDVISLLTYRHLSSVHAVQYNCVGGLLIHNVLPFTVARCQRCVDFIYFRFR